jgi:hypothetical protein
MPVSTPRRLFPTRRLRPAHSVLVMTKPTSPHLQPVVISVFPNPTMHRPIRKLQISNPQPYTPQRHEGPVPAALQPVVVPGLAPTRRPSTGTDNLSSSQGIAPQGRQAESRGNGSGRFESAIPPPDVEWDGRSGDLRGALVPPVGSGTGGGGKPVRPARSTRRAPTSSASVQQSHHNEPERTQRYQDPHELVSPLRDEPPTPVNQPTGASWNQDRTHRTELIESQRTERNPQREVKASVVDAFRSARGNGAQRPGNVKRGRTAQGKDSLVRDGDADDVDCEFFRNVWERS